MVVVGTGDLVGTRFVKTEWPLTEGNTAGTTKQTGKDRLEPQEKSFITKEEKTGL